MMRIRALNAESSEESEGEEEIPTITKEAQEQACFTSYGDALNLLRENKPDEASSILHELLESSTLAEVTRSPDDAEPPGFRRPVFMLKYSCLKNVGNILVKRGDLKSAIDYLLQAANLDGTDVTLWYQIGLAAVKTVDYVLAVDAFLEALRFSPRHWPCLDNVITMLYVNYDFLTCLHFVSRSLTLDPGFVKGLAFRDKILGDQPCLAESFRACYPDAELGDLDLEYDRKEGDSYIQEALEMKAKQREVFKHLWEPDKLKTVGLLRPLGAKSWLALGQGLAQLYTFMYDTGVSLASPIDLSLVTECEVKSAAADKMEVDDIGDGDDADKKATQTEETDEAIEPPPREVAPSSQPDDEAGEGDDPKNRKRRTSFIEQWMWGGKRRSARVRSTARKEADDNLGQALRQLVPRALLPSNKAAKAGGGGGGGDASKMSDDSQDTMELYKLFKESDATGNENHLSNREHVAAMLCEEGYFDTEREETDVDAFLNDSGDYIGEIMLEYTKVLCDKWHLTWPVGLTKIFLELYGRMRRHNPHPSAFSSEDSCDWLSCDAMLTLLHAELLLDSFLQGNGVKHGTDVKDVDKIPCKADQSRLDFPYQDLGQMLYVTGRVDMPASYMLRVYWLKAHVMLQRKAVDTAINDLDTLLYFAEEETEPPEVRLANCHHNNTISNDTANKLLNSLSRNKSLCEVSRLYETEKYADLVPILQETLRSPLQQQPPPPDGDRLIPDRHTQLAMLMDSLHRLKQYQECFYWGEACINEALHKYLAAEDVDQPLWARTIEKLLSGLQGCVEREGVAVIDSLNNGRLARLVQNLTHMLCHQLEAPETCVTMPIESVAPWIVLQQILQHHEQNHSKPSSPKTGNGGGEEEEEDELPASIRVLATAHDFLARRSWCCSNEGALLLHLMDVLIPRLREPDLQPIREDLNQILEQAFFCLYAHPAKRTKGRTTSLAEHGVPQIPLTWQRAGQLYDVYRPDCPPSFDGNTPGIQSDAEPLLKRIVSLVPPDCDPVTVVAAMNNYIDSATDQIPTLSKPFPHQMIDLYYLLADYYFKNSESALAIQHYLLDVCVNPGRLDSWSGMALARGSQLDVKLNSCDIIKSESDFLKRASRTQRCYRRALQLDPSHQTLWIEYGSFAYMIHSFCGRLLKQESDSLSMEMFNVLDTQKEDMLTTAVNCFTTASKVFLSESGDYEGEDNDVQDELWLHHYMLGKAAEKTDSNCPDGYLSQYERCVGHLHKNGALYPRRVNYSNPQNLAVEALEVYYRIHASILKYLEVRETSGVEKSTRELFERHIQRAVDGPFISGGRDSDEETRKRPGGELEGDETESKRMRLLSDGELIEDVIEAIDEMIGKVASTTEKPTATEKDGPTSERDASTAVSKPSAVEVIELFSEDSSVDRPTADDEVVKEVDKKMEVLDLVMEVVKEDDEEDSLQLTPEQICDIIGVAVMDKVPDKVMDKVTDMEVDGEVKVTDTRVEDDKETDDLGALNMSMDSIEKTKTQSLDEREAERLRKCFNTFEENFQKFLSSTTTETDAEGVAASRSAGDGAEGGTKEDEEKKVKSGEDEEKMKQADKDEAKDNRRSSQESTTTASTTGGATTTSVTSTSSEEDSSSSESSESSGSSSDSTDSSKSDRDVDTVVEVAGAVGGKETEIAGPEVAASKPKEDLVKDNSDLATKCLRALEECIIRFPTHYKAMYRLGHYYFRSKQHRDVAKCRDILLGSYRCGGAEWRGQGAVIVQGLFSDRKKNNFFNGVWRIPNQEIDRPGSFASHMSRCMQLLMELLTELKDQALLLELCIQLRKIPDPDKKYLLDSEREQLARQALSLCLKAVRAKLALGVDATLVVDVFKAYQRVQKHFPQKEKVFANLLQDAYRQHQKLKGPVLDQAVKFCQMQIAAIKAAAIPPTPSVTLPQVQPPTAVPPPPQPPARAVHQQTKTPPAAPVAAGPQKPRGRGRPPNQPRVSVPGTAFDYPPRGGAKQAAKQAAQQYQYANMIAQNMASMGNLNYYPMHSLFDLNKLSAGTPNMAGLNMAANMSNSQILDQQLAALNLLNYQVQMGNYQQELMRHYGSSMVGMGSAVPPAAAKVPPTSVKVPPTSAKVPPTSAKVPPTSAKMPASITKVPATVTKASPSTSGIMKDRPGISITAVNKSPKVSPDKPPPTLQQKMLASQSSGKKPGPTPVVQSPRSRSPQTIARIAAAQLAELSRDKTRPHGSPRNYTAKSSPVQNYGSLSKSDAVSISAVPQSPKIETAKLLSFRKGKTDAARSSHKPSNLPDFGPGISVTGLGSSLTLTKTPSVDTKSQSYSNYPYKQQAGSKGGGSRSVGGYVPQGGGTALTRPQTQQINLPHGLNIFPKPGDGGRSAKPQSFSTTKHSQGGGAPSKTLPAASPSRPLTLDKMVFPTGIDPKLQKIGREITVTPSVPQNNSAAMATLNRLQSTQGNQLEIIPKPLDLAVSFPKGITVTKNQDYQPSQQKESPTQKGGKTQAKADGLKDGGKKAIDPFEIITLE